MATTNSEFVTKAFLATQFRQPNTTELTYWTNELDQNYTTPAGLFLTGAQTTAFVTENIVIAQVFKALFGRYMTSGEMYIWGASLQSGASIEQVIDQFLASTELSTRFAIKTSLVDIIQFVHETATGSELDTIQAQTYESYLLNGQMTAAQLALEIGQKTDPNIIGISLAYTALYGTTPSEADLSNYDPDARVALSELFDDFNTYEANSTHILSENSGSLTLPAEGFDARIYIDLTANTIKSDGEHQTLSSGSIANIITVDARELDAQDVQMTGSTANETYYASDNGDVIQMKGGDDTIYSGAGRDIITFEAIPSDNGQDTIFNFSVGVSGDYLDLSNFLTTTGTTNLTPIDATQTAPAAWNNGDVLIINGSVTSSTDVANLFGAGAALAAPTTAGKVVIISSTIIGDANIWSVINQGDVTQVVSNEVELIGVLKNVNSFDIQNFDTTNFM